MPPKTRGRGSAKPAAAEDGDTAKPATPKAQLGPESSNPPHLFILPKNISNEARIITLQNPRYGKEGRYVVCPDRGFYEFSRVSAPKTTPRSCLMSAPALTATKENGVGSNAAEDNGDGKGVKGYVTRTASLCVATPIDPLFLVLPSLAPVADSKAKKLFLSGEDYLDKMALASPQFGMISRIESVRRLVEHRMAAVSETVDAGDETMFRIDENKLLNELLRKAKNMAEKGLPLSMEEKFVAKVLEAPILSTKRDDSSMQELTNEESGASTPELSKSDTQTTVSSTDTAASSLSEVSTGATSLSGGDPVEEKSSLHPISAPGGVADLLRLRTAFDFICSSYLAPHISQSLHKLCTSPESPINFAPLDTHLTHLAKLRSDALASRSLGDFSRKRNLGAEDIETRAEKKRKLDEEEKRQKANESRGVKALKKVNVSGMKKMSDFFKKK